MTGVRLRLGGAFARALLVQQRGVVRHAVRLARPGDLLGQHLPQHGARGLAFAIDQDDDAGALIGQQDHRRIHARQRPGVGHLPGAVDVGQPPSVAIGGDVAVVPGAHARAHGHRHVGRPDRPALRGRQPGRLRLRRQPHAHPGQHVVEAATDPAGGHRGDVGHDGLVLADDPVALRRAHVRLRHVAYLGAVPFTDLATRQAERLEQFTLDQLLVRHAARSGGHFAGDDVQQVVVGVGGTEAVRGLQVLQAGDDVGAREPVGLRPQHQVAGAQAQAAVVDQQVAHLHLLRDPRVVHAELRQVLRDRVVPLQSAGIDQARQHAGRHRLAVGGDLEQRGSIDPLAAAGNSFAGGALVDHLPVAHHAHRQAGQLVAFERGVEGSIALDSQRRGLRRISLSGNGEHHACQQDAPPLKGAHLGSRLKPSHACSFLTLSIGAWAAPAHVRAASPPVP